MAGKAGSATGVPPSCCSTSAWKERCMVSCPTKNRECSSAVCSWSFWSANMLSWADWRDGDNGDGSDPPTAGRRVGTPAPAAPEFGDGNGLRTALLDR